VFGQRAEPGPLAIGVLAGFALGLLVAGIIVAGRTDMRPTLSTNVTEPAPSSQAAVPVVETVTSQPTPLTVTHVVPPVPAPTVTSTVTVTAPPQPPTSLPVATEQPSRIIAPSRPPIWP
jgi:hypothetical protein